MKMLRKKIDCKNLEIFQENIFDRVCFSKVITLQHSDCNFTTNRLNRIFFLEYVPKTSCLKKNILWKKNNGGPAF